MNVESMLIESTSKPKLNGDSTLFQRSVPGGYTSNKEKRTEAWNQIVCRPFKTLFRRSLFQNARIRYSDEFSTRRLVY